MTQAGTVVSDAVFRALTESSPDGIVLVNQEGRIILVNAQHIKAVPGRKTDVKLRHEVA